ncbi:MAG: phosphoglycerate kinase [Kiloniellales bacterium]|nr:phosphoglycerate kinase [Kiloniellales bacterium]
MADFLTIDDLKLSEKTVLVRVDLNVPMADGQVSDDTRIERIVPSVRELMAGGARVVLLSHFGRPKGERKADCSLSPLVPAIEAVFGDVKVAFADDCIGSVAKFVINGLGPESIALLENLRFHPGEEENDPAFAAALADLGDIYVNDAFSAAHRAHASVEGIARLLPAAAGRLMEAELTHLSAALDDPKRPLAAVVGGAKVSTKLALLGNLVEKVDRLIIGGGMANTFLYAKGFPVGRSLCETEMSDMVGEILKKAEEADCEVLLPEDVVIAPGPEAPGQSRVVSVEDVPADSMILDCGPDTVNKLSAALEDCRSLVWNGPLGLFEVPPFDAATTSLARKAGELSLADRLLSVAGGGDTVAALAHAGVVEQFSYVSTAGGAFLEWLEGKTLPGVKALQEAA